MPGYSSLQARRFFSRADAPGFRHPPAALSASLIPERRPQGYGEGWDPRSLEELLDAGLIQEAVPRCPARSPARVMGVWRVSAPDVATSQSTRCRGPSRRCSPDLLHVREGNPVSWYRGEVPVAEVVHGHHIITHPLPGRLGHVPGGKAARPAPCPSRHRPLPGAGWGRSASGHRDIPGPSFHRERDGQEDGHTGDLGVGLGRDRDVVVRARP